MDPLLNELQDRAIMDDQNAQVQLDSYWANEEQCDIEELALTNSKYDHSKRPCTCGSGLSWMNCTGLPNGDTSWCG
jgi:hypothetical protein